MITIGCEQLQKSISEPKLTSYLEARWFSYRLILVILFLERTLDWVLLGFNVPGLFLFVGGHTVCFANEMFVLTVIFEYLRAEQAGKSKASKRIQRVFL